MNLSLEQEIRLIIAVELDVPVERVSCTFAADHLEIAFDPPLTHEEDGRMELLADLVKRLQEAADGPH
jgi:hypothetical protein